MRSRIVRLVLFVGLACFYTVGAMEHARRVNTFKARGDQSGYLWDAQNVQNNWKGRQPPVVIGERNRMPVYAGFLALFWDPASSNDEFFEQAKRWNIYLSLALLAMLALIFPLYLPPLAATNLTLVVAFGYFIFKAGYAQSELLFYFFFFLAFLLFLDLLSRPAPGKGMLIRAACAGAIAGVAHLTKASMLPLVGIFLAVMIGDGLLRFRAGHGGGARRLAAALVTLAAFLAVLSPYLSTNKRVFGRYFYNVNTTFYMWYDNWPQASVGTIKHGDGVGWPTMPEEELPGAARYWREHTAGQIASRILAGFRDMVERSYLTYWYFNYVVVYGLFALAVIAARRDAFWRYVHERPGVTIFVVSYAVVYLFGIAFYAPVSGTGTTRFLMAHLLPFFFIVSLLLSRGALASAEWRLAGARITTGHLQVFIAAMLAFDIVFRIWPRLMTTYGGF